MLSVYCILMFAVMWFLQVMEAFIKRSPLMISRGRSQEQLDAADLPIPIYLDASIDGGALSAVRGFLACFLRFADIEIIKHLFSAKEKEPSDAAADIHNEDDWNGCQSPFNLIIMGYLEGKDNAFTNQT